MTGRGCKDRTQTQNQFDYVIEEKGLTTKVTPIGSTLKPEPQWLMNHPHLLIITYLKLVTAPSTPCLPPSELSLERYPLAELAPGDNMATCFTASLVWDLSVLPALYLPASSLEHELRAHEPPDTTAPTTAVHLRSPRETPRNAAS